VPLRERSGAARKANPSRGGGAKPEGSLGRRRTETAGLPNGGGVIIVVERTLEELEPHPYTHRKEWGFTGCIHGFSSVGLLGVEGLPSEGRRDTEVGGWHANSSPAACIALSVLKATDHRGLPDQKEV
jgi:hypothetical protein